MFLKMINDLSFYKQILRRNGIDIEDQILYVVEDLYWLICNI